MKEITTLPFYFECWFLIGGEHDPDFIIEIISIILESLITSII